MIQILSVTYWSAPTYIQAPITGFNVYRGNSSDGNYSLVGSSSTITFTDTLVTKDSLYYYMVTAVTNLGESLPSNIIIITAREGETNKTPFDPSFTYLGILVMVALYTRYRYLKRKS